ncbi:MAG: preprotein translocase subunit YajC [Bacteroidota bacterium]|nr:preprotein translocase subunit YajC [Bacteroidota bacterium]MDE2834647.1 preprotein translocase subunit YajC [Bacteroidota bacterium]MDE2957186.1 preprotein translocase subunit YajC [Bacteroidota bacterium]
MMAILLLAAQNAPAANPFGGFGMILPLLGIFLVFYFFIIRPQQKREKQRKAMIAAVAKSDRVITAGGIHGIVTQVQESSVLVDVGGVKLRVEKNSLANVVNKQ